VNYLLYLLFSRRVCNSRINNTNINNQQLENPHPLQHQDQEIWRGTSIEQRKREGTKKHLAKICNERSFESNLIKMLL
jgi:hypothetical protein